MWKVVSALCVVVALGLMMSPVMATDQDKVLDSVSQQIDKSDKLTAEMKLFVKQKLLPLSKDKVLIEETVKLNDEKVSMDEIKKIDKEWKAAEEELPIMTEKLNNKAAKRLKEVSDKLGVIAEAFAMCNQGAVVGESELTGDYWQGDEAKWQNSYNEAKGGVDIGDAEFDASANVTLQQVSLPIVNEKGEVIGAITWGIQIDKM